MTTSRTPLSLTSSLQAERIPMGTLEYFRSRLRSRFHQLVVNEFLKQEDRGMTQTVLAKRIGKDGAVLSRLLRAPGNWTLDTVSDLLLGLHAEPTLSAIDLESQIPTVVVKSDVENSVLEGQRQFKQEQDIDPANILESLRKAVLRDAA